MKVVAAVLVMLYTSKVGGLSFLCQKDNMTTQTRCSLVFTNCSLTHSLLCLLFYDFFLSSLVVLLVRVNKIGLLQIIGTATLSSLCVFELGCV